MSVSGIEGFTPFVPPQLGTVTGDTVGTIAGGTRATESTSGVEFGELVLDNIDRLESLQDRTDQLAVQAATGDLTNIHDYTIAATETQVATQLTVAVRNKALEAFHEVMRMHVG